MDKPPIDLTAPGAAKAIAQQIKDDVEAHCVERFDEGPRWHLGASLIGDPCQRKLWYHFRWVYHEKFTGRMYRLFNRGHREEDRFVEWLRGTGWQVWTHDESKPKNAKGEYPQFRVSYANGHGGGSLDGIGIPPPKYRIDKPLLLEFKTSGTGAGFTKTAEDGVAIGKPQHFSQMSTYGSDPAYGLTHGLYQIVNKNDDSLAFEIVKLNWQHGEQMRIKTAQIVASQTPPPKLSMQATYKDCQYCPARQVCHFGAPPLRNCRSCRNASPIEGGDWHCGLYGATIPREAVKAGCPQWSAITGQ